MNIFIVAAVVIAALFILKNFGKKTKDNTSRPSADKKPTQLKENDKLIVIENISHENMRKVLTEFCNTYNEQEYVALPRLYDVSAGKFAVTFPFDIDFERFCYTVNYLKYAEDIQPLPDVYAWLTTRVSDRWTSQIGGKKAMVFLAADDTEADNVFLTTDDNIGYKMGFAVGYQRQLLSSPEENYRKPSISTDQLDGLSFEDFE